VLLNPIVMYFVIWGCGGVGVCGAVFSLEVRLRLLLRFPFEGMVWLVLWLPMGSRRLSVLLV
jgi:hypothetical protein